MSVDILFDGWSSIARVLVVGVLAYAALVVLLRVSGKRTLSKMNAFDFIVTVALGSTLATILLSRDVSLAAGVTALAVLIGAQFVITWCSVRFQTVQQLVKAQPTLLLYRGKPLADALRRQRVTHEELLTAIRTQGNTDIEDAEAVVLETDGSFTVLTSGGKTRSALANVENPLDEKER